VKTNKQSRREAKQLFRGCLVSGVLDQDRVRQTVGKVIEIRPRGYISMLGHFQRLVKLELDRRTARVESAVPLPPLAQADLKKKLGGLYGPGLDFQFEPNPALIGGVRIKVGSDVYDGSIQARLNALAESF
jgi:F-type H+-transporting ATPase subunit delta